VWWPLITDDAERRRVRAVIGEIATALEAFAFEHAIDALADHAVLRAYLANDGTVDDEHDVAGTALAEAIARVERASAIGLFGGATRIGWTIAHVVGDDADIAAACRVIDEPLERALASWDGDYDLIGGLVGFGVYALERGDAGRSIAEKIVGHLERTARPRFGGLAWHTRPELLVDIQRAEAPAGFWNLGLAHGMPGVVAMLARFVRAGFEPARSRALLDAAVTHLLAAPGAATDPKPSELDIANADWKPSAASPDIANADPKPSAAPHYVNWQPALLAPTSRLAWCYGDLGVAVALVGAAQMANDARWRTHAIALAHACADRSDSQGDLAEAGLCHGTVGIAHLFNRLAHALDEPRFAGVARAWIGRTLAWRRAGEPIAGFPSLDPTVEGFAMQPDPTLLTGAAGVALALHAAISEVEPTWDRLLLVDLPLAGT
jgi:hypothetical protein